MATTGVVFGAVTMLWMIKRVFFGKVTREENRGLRDLTAREVGYMLPLIILIFAIGFAPGFLLKKMEKSVSKFIDRVSLTRIIHGNESSD